MRDELKKTENESNLEYGVRLYTNKVQYGLSNRDIYDVYVSNTGDTRAESSVRCEFASILKGYELGFEKAMDGKGRPNRMEEIKEELGELYVVKQEVKNKTNQLNRMKRDFVKSVEIANDIKDYLSDELRDLRLFKGDSIGEVSEKVLVVQISDWHIGYEIKQYQGNTYNYREAEFRLSILMNEIREVCSIYGINRVDVVNCGDITEGTSLRANQSYECEFNTAEQISKATKILYEFVSSISYFARVNLISVGGNHQRMNGLKNANLEGDNNNIIIVETLKMLTDNNDNIYVYDIDYKDDSCYFMVNGMNFLAIHGDNRVADAKKLFDSECVDVVLRGHYHNFNVQSQNNGGYVITGGSLFGHNPYSSQKMACTTKASQTLIVVGEGKIDMIKNVELN